MLAVESSVVVTVAIVGGAVFLIIAYAIRVFIWSHYPKLKTGFSVAGCEEEVPVGLCKPDGK